MQNILYILAFVVVAVSAFPGGDHHGDGHDENCVDISRYSEILYNTSFVDVCTYRCNKICTPRKQSACVSVPVTECEIVGYANCDNEPTSHVYHDDKLVPSTYTPQRCFQSGEQVLNEKHKVPVCSNVTKQQCDSKWVIDPYTGEKVWNGNENCKDYTWEECHLEDVVNPVTVPTWTCVEDEAVVYNTAKLNEITVTTHNTKCAAAAYPVCSTTHVQKCTDVEFEECVEVVEPVCFGNIEISVPYQTYDHRLKCIVD